MLGRVLAANLNKNVGDTVELYVKTFEVVGIYESPIVFENGGAVMLLADCRSTRTGPMKSPVSP